ncbi:ATP-dependent helicase [Cryobacterium levicorallinum]|uniref:DNA 3'-5' helicase n=1 Tax=Cryobacterium levicorallinum TaxID=995038 RepID=A0A1I2ZZK7_9MICO|nr:ATP-dependent helicase [Cryobacterium levicorallinum]TFB82758.1 ATP-dependent helicase [Cryobacterium levicorallinum]GEP26458.1 DNA helicase [Cryobacterium levicorallinum]SFH43076.1 DNA helicase-2 / ATP-dependent DNA helicase PcrA [Cryobacterium levicorallinum]
MNPLETAISELDSWQRDAFDVKSHCVVLAPPGSGKTKLLVTRLAQSLVAEVAAPQGAACITLTNGAALEMRQRFGAISSDRRTNLFVGTVHSFALNRIVRPFAHAAGEPGLATVRICRSAELDALWVDALDSAKVPSDERSNLRSTVNKFRSLLVDDAEWSRLGKYPILARDAFFRQMNHAGVIDFHGMVEAAVKFVEGEPSIATGLRSMFPRIYVDEYQDLAPGLDRIVRSLSFASDTESSILFAVGDADQAIYRWTGTNPKLLLELAELSGITKRKLNTNYRSGEQLVKATRRLLGEREMPVTPRDGGSITVHKVAGGILGQANFAAAQIAPLAAQGMSLHEIGIFCATNDIAAETTSALNRQGVPAWFRAQDSWETPLSIDLERICAWVAHGQDSSGHALSEVIADIQRTIPGLSEVGVGGIWPVGFAAAPGSGALEFLETVLDSIMLEAAVEARRQIEEESLGIISELRDGSLVGQTIAELGEKRVSLGKCYVTTLTSSKGLEFDRTFVLGLEDGRIPHYYATKNNAELAEERSKFYVSVTRARDHVYLLWSGYTQDRYGRKHLNPVSRFVTELSL